MLGRLRFAEEILALASRLARDGGPCSAVTRAPVRWTTRSGWVVALCVVWAHWGRLPQLRFAMWWDLRFGRGGTRVGRALWAARWAGRFSAEGDAGLFYVR